MSLWHPFSHPSLTPSQIQDLRLAASKMTGAARRAFQAEMTLKYCRGSARLAETIGCGFFATTQSWRKINKLKRAPLEKGPLRG